MGKIIKTTNIGVGTNFIVIGKLPINTKVKDIAAIVLKNGGEIAETPGISQDEYPGKNEESVLTGVGRDGGSIGKGPTDTGPIGREPTTTGTIGKEPTGDGSNTTPQATEETDKKKKKSSNLGKATKIGTGILAAAILFSAIATTKIVAPDTYERTSDYVATSEVSDILLTKIDGQEIAVPSSVIANPGNIIKHQRAEAIAETLGTSEGINKYYRSTTNESRVKEEEDIKQITEKFDAQQQIIVESVQILQDTNSSDEEKKEALQRIMGAKSEQFNIYEGSLSLFLNYNKQSIDAFTNSNGGDSRTEYENSVAYLETGEYDIAMRNLLRDMESLGSILGTLDNPQELFEEPSPKAGTTEKDYLINLEIFGKKINLIETAKRYYVDVNYAPDVQLEEGHQVGEGEFSIEGNEITNVTTTKRNVFAIGEIIERLLNKKDLGKISVFGKTVYDSNSNKGER